MKQVLAITGLCLAGWTFTLAIADDAPPSPAFAAPAVDAKQPILFRKDAEFFEKNIRPILVEKCYNCHSAQAKILRGKLQSFRSV